ncbi:DUF1028 domain-containing protein [Saccharopolyspora pogona]|uniref:DUF1028 domain-containing protein n=1 Tax=Saccharopolyspora pogona TaxID=333966 RepID=UPI0037C8ECD0
MPGWQPAQQQRNPGDHGRAFESATGELEERLLAAMHAALEAGGEAGPVHSEGGSPRPLAEGVVAQPQHGERRPLAARCGEGMPSGHGVHR